MFRLFSEWMYSETKLQTENEERDNAFMWKISNFSQCSEVKSFRIKREDTICELLLYPNGKNEEDKSYVSIYLRLKSTDRDDVDLDDENWSVIDEDGEYIVEVAIVDASGQKTRSIQFPADADSGNDNFILRSDLFENRDLLLPNDELIVACTLMKKKGTESKSPSDISDSAEPTIGDNSSIQMVDEEPMEVVLKIGEEEIKVKKALLESKSPVFDSMLKQELAGTNILNITDVEMEVMQALVNYMQLDNFSFSDARFVLKLLAASDKYEFSELSEDCAEYLTANLSSDNIFDVISSPCAQLGSKLHKNCIDFICRELPSITELPDWKTNLDSRPHALSEIIEQLAVKEKESKSNEKGQLLIMEEELKQTKMALNKASMREKMLMRPLLLVCLLFPFIILPHFEYRSTASCLYLMKYETLNLFNSRGRYSIPRIYATGNAILNWKNQIYAIKSANEHGGVIKQVMNFEITDTKDGKSGKVEKVVKESIKQIENDSKAIEEQRYSEEARNILKITYWALISFAVLCYFFIPLARV